MLATHQSALACLTKIGSGHWQAEASAPEALTLMPWPSAPALSALPYTLALSAQDVATAGLCSSAG